MTSYNKLFIFFSFSFLIAVYVANFLRDIIECLFLYAFFILILLNFYIYIRKCILFLLAISTGLIIGILWSCIHISDITDKTSFINGYNDTQAHDLILEIDNIYKKSLFDIEYSSKIIKIGNKKLEKNIEALFKTKSNFGLSSGDLVSFSSKVEPVKNFNSNFDYTSFLQTKNIYTSFYSHSFQNHGNAGIPLWKENILEIRKKFLDVIYKLYPEKEAVFLGGILIGARESVPEDMQSSFNNSGLTHLIAVSGYNITIIIVFLSYLFSYFPKIFRVVCISGAIVGYALIVGDSAAVIRASLMGLVGYYVLMSGRQGDSLAIILFTALIMVFINPFLINYDIGFQLSFLAVFGLLYTQGFFEKIFFFLPKKFAIQESFVLTLSAFVFTIPIMLVNFGQISVLAPIANMLVAWSIPLAMLFGVLSILGFMFSVTLGYIIGFIEYFLLKWTVSVATLFGNFEFSILKIDFGDYGMYFQALYFMLVIFCILYFPTKKAT